MNAFVDQVTRCPACKTVFRVVNDQLQVSDGWVRCGRCSNVFNANENRISLDGNWALQSPPGSAKAGSAAATASSPDDEGTGVETAFERAMHRARQDAEIGVQQRSPAAGLDAHADDKDPSPQKLPVPEGEKSASRPAQGRTRPSAEGDWPFEDSTAKASLQPLPTRAPAPTQLPQDTATPEHDDSDFAPTVASHWVEPDAEVVAEHEPWRRTVAPDSIVPRNSWASTQPASDLALVSAGLHRDRHGGEPSSFGDSWQQSSWPQSLPPSVIANLGPQLAGPDGAFPGKPSFMRQAEHEQRWHAPHMQALLYAGLAVAGVLLCLQLTVAYRDTLAARYTSLRSPLVQLCGALGCTVQSVRAIELLTVESSGLVKTRQAAQYRLQVSLRNRSAMELALPALDVTVTDAQGDLIARKVILPQELGSTIDRLPGSHGSVIAPGKEITLQGELTTPGGDAQVIAGYTLELFYP